MTISFNINSIDDYDVRLYVTSLQYTVRLQYYEHGFYR